MRHVVTILLLASVTTGCVHAPAIPDQSAGPDFGRAGTLSKIEARVVEVRTECKKARDGLRKEARDLERRHNLWAVLGSSFGATGGAAALGATADADKGVKNTLTVTGALLAVAGAVATGVSSKDAELMNKLSERALKIKSLESDVDALVASRADQLPTGEEGKGDALLLKKLGDLDEACAEP